MVVVEACAAGEDLHALSFERFEIFDGRALGAGDKSAAVVEEDRFRQRVLLRQGKDKSLEQRFAERVLALAHVVFGNGDYDVFLPLLKRRAHDGFVGHVLFGAGGVDRDGKPRFALLFGADGEAVLSGETDEILHGGVVIDEHLHSLRRGERVDRLFRLYDRHRAGFAESVHGNHIKDLLIIIFLRREYHIFDNRYIKNMDKTGGTIGSAGLSVSKRDF